MFFWLLNMRYLLAIAFTVISATSCQRHEPPVIRNAPVAEQPLLRQAPDTLIYDNPGVPYIHTGNVQPSEVVAFAKTLKGIPYAYACSSPEAGFDCSGFINYVFDQFQIIVPRSSRDFTNVGKQVPVSHAKPGDLILFTGTDPNVRTVGHIGIVVYTAADSLSFIHSSSGSANGVTITPLNEYYRGRFMKIMRIFRQNAEPV